MVLVFFNREVLIPGSLFGINERDVTYCYREYGGNELLRKPGAYLMTCKGHIP